MDPQQQKRPKRLAATKPKSYVPFQANRKSPTLNTRSPPNLNARPTTPRSPIVQPPATIARQDESVLHVEAEIHSNMAAGPIDSEPSLNELDNAIQASTPLNLEAVFKSLTEKFERTVQDAVSSFIARLNELEENLGASLDFERERIDTLQENQTHLEKKMEKMEKELNEMKVEIIKNSAATNKSERFSRRNNIRLVGIKEAAPDQREDCVEIAEEMLRTKFEVTTKVERAHRDGKKMDGRPRHILIKFLSYREKVDIMRRARAVLKDEAYFVVDDLTQADLQEKQRWIKQVQQLYQNGTKLRFYAGKWRQAGGVPYKFE